MKLFNYYLISIVFLVSTVANSQEPPSSETAIEQYSAISATMAKSFPEDDFKTYARESFTQAELETYLSQHFQRMDLLPYIEGHHHLKMNAYLHSGNWFSQIGFPKESIKSFQNFFAYYKQIESDLSETERKAYLVMRFFAHYMLAENYAKIGLFDKANKEHHINMAFTNTFDDVYYPSSLNNYGLFLYLNKRELDSALIYFERASHIIQEKFPNHTLAGSIRDNIADIHVEKENYLKARSLYETNFNFYRVVVDEETLKEDVPRLVSAGSQLVKTNLDLKDVRNALNIFEELEEIVVDRLQKGKINPTSQIEYLRTKEQLLREQNKIEAAYNTAKRIETYSDSLRAVASLADEKWQNEFSDITVDRVGLNFKIDQLQQEAKIKSQKAKLWIIGSVSSAFIILLLFLFLSRHQHLTNSKNKQLLAEQNLENSVLKVNQLNQEIKSKERDLSDFAINLIQNQEWISSLATKIEDYKSSEGAHKKELLNDLEQVVKNKITFDEDTKLFFERLDKLSDAFYSQLMTNYPNLSKNEIQLCSLIRLKMDSRSIATLQNITTASLNTSRYRLRKKLELADDVNLDDFIHSL